MLWRGILVKTLASWSPEEGIITRTLEGPEVACSCQAGGIIDHTADKDEVELTSSPTCSSCLSLCYLAHDAREGKPSCVGREQAQPDLALATRMSLEGTPLVFHETSAIPPRQQLLASSVPPFLNSVNDFHRFSICPGSESIGPGSQPICPSSKPILNLRPVADQSWKIYGEKMRLRDRRREVGRQLDMFSGGMGSVRGLDVDMSKEEEGELSDMFKHYVNLITTHHDVSNEGYKELINASPFTKDLIDITDVFDYEEDNDEIGDEDDPLFDGSLGKDQGVATDTSIRPSVIPTNIQGSASLQKRIIELCQEYEVIFSRAVKPVPASVPPMKLSVDKDIWEKPFNRLPARPQSTSNQEEIRRQIKKMLDLGVIKPSTSVYWSQVLLAPKSNGEKRFCIDLRALNKALEDQGWQIPNIKMMIDRIGALRMTIFGSVDLTSGYHQFPIEVSSSWMTAFITFMGVFQWNRVPMGIKPAANYFQRTMAQHVLEGLLYDLCEVYIDDVLIYGRDEDQYVSNLRAVFERLRDRKVTINPDKCIFGADEIEFVGHLIDKDGATFSKTKFDSVIEFIKPSNLKELRSFLGLVNYFRDHIKDHSIVTHPLQTMIVAADKGPKVRVPGRKPVKFIVWTPEAEDSFMLIKNLINNCPKLFYTDDELPIYLHTDASDYAVGAYLFQIKDDKEIPIRFLSKTLSGAQLRWSTIEKECFAIFISLKKFADLLLGVPFILRTDHRNLLYLNEAGSSKVTRWKVEIQNYQFKIEHIPGVENIPADAFSRLITPSLKKVYHPQVLLSLHHKRTWSQDKKEMKRLIDEVLPPRAPRAKRPVVAPVIIQPSAKPQPQYSKARHLELARHHGPLGHFGIEKTLLSAKQSGLIGANLERDVKEFIRFCPVCQKMSYIRPVIYSQPFVSSGTHPMRELHIDTVGPFPLDNTGALHIVVIIDNFTRYTTLHPAPNVSAEEAAIALFKHCCVYGVPDIIHTDQGSQYCNSLISSLTACFKIKHELSIAYSKQQNGIVERVNKEVGRHLQMLCSVPEQSKTWASMIPLVQRIINSTNHVAIGFSPAQLVFGGSIDHRRNLFPSSVTPSDAILEAQSSTPAETHAWVTNMINQQAIMIETARTSQEQLNESNIAKRVDARNGEELSHHAIGSYVLVKYPQSAYGRGPPTKLLPFWKGPMRVESIVGDKYQLRNIVNGKSSEYHVQLLKPFLYDERFIDPVEVAIAEHDEYLVDKILEHKFLGGDKDKLVCRVSWIGYQETSWEPWANLRLVQQFHDYARAHQLVRFIPKNFKGI